MDEPSKGELETKEFGPHGPPVDKIINVCLEHLNKIVNSSRSKYSLFQNPYHTQVKKSVGELSILCKKPNTSKEAKMRAMQQTLENITLLVEQLSSKKEYDLSNLNAAKQLHKPFFFKHFASDKDRLCEAIATKAAGGIKKGWRERQTDLMYLETHAKQCRDNPKLSYAEMKASLNEFMKNRAGDDTERLHHMESTFEAAEQLSKVYQESDENLFYHLFSGMIDNIDLKTMPDYIDLIKPLNEALVLVARLRNNDDISYDDMRTILNDRFDDHFEIKEIFHMINEKGQFYKEIEGYIREQRAELRESLGQTKTMSKFDDAFDRCLESARQKCQDNSVITIDKMHKALVQEFENEDEYNTIKGIFQEASEEAHNTIRIQQVSSTIKHN